MWLGIRPGGPRRARVPRIPVPPQTRFDRRCQACWGGGSWSHRLLGIGGGLGPGDRPAAAAAAVPSGHRPPLSPLPLIWKRASYGKLPPFVLAELAPQPWFKVGINRGGPMPSGSSSAHKITRISRKLPTTMACVIPRR